MKQKRLMLNEGLELAYQDWNDAIAGLDDTDFERMVYHKWTLKDVTGHVFAYLDLALRHVKAYKKRKKLASPRAPSYGYFNRREAERLRSVSLEKLRADMDTEFHELIALVPTLSADDLKKQFPAQWTNSKYKTTLRYLVGETATHIRAHADEVKAWKKKIGE